MVMFYFSSVVIFIWSTWWLFKTWLSKEDDWKTLGPMGVLMLCFLAYCGFGPMLVMSFFGATGHLMIEWADHAFAAGVIALTAFSFVMIGYGMTKKKQSVGQVVIMPPNNMENVWKWGLRFYFLGWFALLVAHHFSIGNMYNVAGGDLSAVAADYDLGGFQFYVHHISSITRAMAVLLMLVALFSRSPLKMIVSGLLLLNTCLIVMASGFRQQIAFLFLLVICAVILFYRKNPNWNRGGKKALVIKISWLVGGLFFLISAMSIGRSYGRGVDFELVGNTTFAEKMVAPFKETAGVYFVGGLVCDYVAEKGAYTYFDPFYATLLRAIPRQWCSLKLIEKKENPPSLLVINEALSAENGLSIEQNKSAGQAGLFYVEYFGMFGWFGLVGFSMLLGSVCRRIENYLVTHPGFISSISYILHSGFIFIYFHRGLMGQQVEGYVFCVFLPLFLLKFANRAGMFDMRALFNRRRG